MKYQLSDDELEMLGNLYVTMKFLQRRFPTFDSYKEEYVSQQVKMINDFLNRKEKKPCSSTK